MTDPGWPRRWVARAGLVAVAAAAFRSSYDALVVVGQRAHMGDPRMLPLCLDGLAISTAAAIEGGRRRDWWPWLVLVAADVISTSLQVAAAPDDWSSQVVAAIPTPAALAAFHVIVWAVAAPAEAVVEGQQGGVAPAAETDAVESGRRESNPRPPGPKPGALPTAPLPDDVRPLGALDHGRGVAGTGGDSSRELVAATSDYGAPEDGLLARARAAKVAMPGIGRARLAGQLGVSDRKARDLLAALAEEQAA